MLVAIEKKKSNIVEYVLYMWQLEDLIRSCNFDIRLIRKTIVDQYNVEEELRVYIMGWYEQFSNQMVQEGVKQKGHISDISTVITSLEELHSDLINQNKDLTYKALYDDAKEVIAELINKTKEEKEINACLTALYGLLVLKLKKQTVSKETESALQSVSKLLSRLAHHYKENTPTFKNN